MTATTQTAKPLLVELGCEELPARQLGHQLELLGEGLHSRLKDAELLVDDEKPPTLLGTPRRLAVIIDGVLSGQADRELERKGPAERAAFDADGRPTRAAEGFARSVGVPVDQLERLENEQGRWLFARIRQPGQALSELLPDMLDATVKAMAGARSMRWSDRAERFLRPVRWLVVLHGEDVVPVSAFGLESGRETQGHRIHAAGTHSVPDVHAYAGTLKQAYVQVDPNKRRRAIRAGAETLARSAGLEAEIDEALLDEVAGLTEWPVPVIGSFDERFLEVPAEALISSMEQHQKCFPMRHADGRLAARFIAVANIESRDMAAMTSGFERVIRPRLADARFFFEQDRRETLEARLPRLDRIKFQEKLGSVGAKSRRLQALAADYAGLLGADFSVTARAALLSKCDLVTEMVGEFPELQGIMGRYYALADGEPEAVAAAIESHYLPRHAGDALPTDAAGRALALADRLDTLVGVFSAGQKPKGGKDPFALRRAALGVIRILEDAGARVSLSKLIELAADHLAADLADEVSVELALLNEVEEFLLERLRSHAAESGIEINTAAAVLAVQSRVVADFLDRARAVQDFADDPMADSLIAANKRIANLLKQADADVPGELNHAALVEAAERDLARAVEDAVSDLDAALEQSDYPQALARLAALREPVDRFFDEVMVMCDDEQLRRHRLSLLKTLRGQFLRVADVARLGR